MFENPSAEKENLQDLHQSLVDQVFLIIDGRIVIGWYPLVNKPLAENQFREEFSVRRSKILCQSYL